MNTRQRVLAGLLFALLPLTAFSSVVTDGYTDKRSYNPGDTVKIYVNGSGTVQNAQLQLMDVNNVVMDMITANVVPQAATTTNPWEDGFGYALTTTYIIPYTLPSGVYSWENKIFFIIKSITKNAAITLIYPTNTEEAYNPIGGKSLYDYNSNGGRAHTVSFQRPYNNWMVQGVRTFCIGFLQWANTLAGYDFQMIADVDVDDYSEFQNSRLLVVVGHSEYWTRTARMNFDAFVNSGKDAVVLSGNTMWWQVRYNADKTKLICYKDTVLDPEQNPLLKTYTWPTASLQYSVLTSIGVDWVHGAYANKSYHGVSGFKILDPNSPLLAGTGVAFHGVINCQANEDDATLFSGFDSNNDPILDTTTLGFCKIEMIGYDYGESIYYPNNPQTGYGTFIAFKKSPSSGNVINVGNSNWCSVSTGSSTGGFAGYNVSIIKTITLNMFNLLLSGTSIYSKPNGCNVLDVATANEAKNNCSIFPNPSAGNVFVHFDSPPEKDCSLQLFNAMGQLVQSQTLEKTGEQEIDLTNLAEGTYYYYIRTEEEIIARGKIMLVR